MTDKQGTLIYIEEDNKREAEFMSKSFVNTSLKNRAYINALGSELVLKYLATEGFDVSNLFNIHSISKVLEIIDVSDIILPNIRIDVRVVFDENKIFIPKSHFNLSITPNIYVVLKLEKDLSHAELLGFCEPKIINLKNQNSDYYFIAKEELTTPDKLANYIKDSTYKTEYKLAQDDFEKAQELFISMADHDISNSEKEELIELMFKSKSLREKILEFDNFETLSYNVGSLLNKSALTDEELKNNVLVTLPTEENENSENLENSEDLENSLAEQNEEQQEQGNSDNEKSSLDSEVEVESLGDDSVLLESFFDDMGDTSLEAEDVSLDLPSESLTDESLTDENEQKEDTPVEELQATEVSADENSTENLENENSDLEEEVPSLNAEMSDDDFLNTDIDGEDLLSDNVGEDLEQTLELETENDKDVEATEDLSLNLEAEEDAVTNFEEPEIEVEAEDETSAQTESEAVVEENIEEEKEDEEFLAAEDSMEDLTLEDTNFEDLSLDMDEESIQDVNLLEEDTNAETNSEEEENQDLPSEEQSPKKDTIKLSSVSGDIVNELINKNIESQQENLDKIDYSKNKIDATAIPSNVSSLDFSNAKIEANNEAEKSGKFESPKDLSELKPVNQEVLGYGDDIEQETIDMNKMKSVKVEDIEEHTDSVVDFHNISQVNSPTTPVENLDEKLNTNVDHEVMDLPDVNSFAINSDGSSSIDNLDMNFELNTGDEHLMDLDVDMSSLEFNNNDIDDSSTQDLTNLSQVNAPKTPVNKEINTDNEEQEENNSESSLDDFNSLNDSEQNKQESSSEDTFDFGDESDFLDDINLDDMDNVETLDNLDNSANVDDELLSDESFENKDNEEIEISEHENPQEEENVQEALNLDEEFEEDKINEDDLNLEESLNTDDQPQDLEQPQEDVSNAENAENVETEEDLSNENIEELLGEDDLDSLDISEISQDEEADNSQDEEIENYQDEEIENLADIQENNEISNEEELKDDYIVEPEPVEKEFTVSENSVVISDKTFNVGEIQIDINVNADTPVAEGDEEIEELYDKANAVPGEAFLQSSGTIGSVASTSGKKSLGLGLGILGVFVSLIIVGIIGFSVSKIIKQVKNPEPQPLEDTISTNTNEIVDNVNSLDIDPANVVNMNTNTSMPVSTKNKTKNLTTPTKVTETSSAKPSVKSLKKIPNTAFIEVKKLTWEVPDYISYDANFKQYFQSAGKSLKLSLTSDLLLANDYSYSSKMKVSVLYDKNGTFTEAKILQSSGSAQIDNIVLQTVNQTLKVLKAPHSVGNDESTTVILKIYF